MSIASKFAAGLLAAACVGMVSADEEVILKIEKPADILQSKAVFESGDETLAFKGGNVTLYSKEAITVDPAKKYRLKGEFCLKGGKPGRLYFGFVPYDQNKVQILPCNITGNNKTLTAVAEDAKKGDKVIKVKDASKWNFKYKYSCIAFNAKEDYSDLPNRNISHTVVPHAKKNGEVWEVELKSPLKADVPAGTVVRQQFDGGTYIYAAGSFKTIGKWTERKGTVAGFAVNGAPSSKFWKGTVTARVVILFRGGDKSSETEFRDIKVEEVKNVK